MDPLEMIFTIPSEKINKLLADKKLFNPFIPNAPFLYPLKTSENGKVFCCFQGVENTFIGNEWVNTKRFNS